MTTDDPQVPETGSLDRIRDQAAAQSGSEDAGAARRRPRKRVVAKPPELMPGAEPPADEPSVAESTVVETAPSYWEPGTRLQTRVSPNAVPARRAFGPDRGRMLALAILVVALLAAIGLYVLANVLVNNDEQPARTAEQTEQPE